MDGDSALDLATLNDCSEVCVCVCMCVCVCVCARARGGVCSRYVHRGLLLKLPGAASLDVLGAKDTGTDTRH